MNEIKYEPLYGLQKPFDNGPADSTAYGLFRDGDEYIYYKIDKTSVYCFDTDNQWSHIDGAPTIPFLAMRRIIQEPKRWTVEDKKAGRLPEVGSVIHFINDIKDVEFVGSTRNGKTWIYKYSDGSMLFAPSQCFTPLETPEEKAEWLREEWCRKALDSAGLLSEMKRYDLKRLGEYIGSIHDALLSGALSVPTKGSE